VTLSAVCLWVASFFLGAAFALHPLTRPAPGHDHRDHVRALLALALLCAVIAYFTRS
jgi:hypothetical protein